MQASQGLLALRPQGLRSSGSCRSQQQQPGTRVCRVARRVQCRASDDASSSGAGSEQDTRNVKGASGWSRRVSRLAPGIRLVQGAMLAAALAIGGAGAARADNMPGSSINFSVSASDTATADPAPAPAPTSGAAKAPQARAPPPTGTSAGAASPSKPGDEAAKEAQKAAQRERDQRREERKKQIDSLSKNRESREMSYTEFWELLCRKKVKTVQYSSDERSILVSFSTGKQQRLFLPYDPDLFPKLVEMGVKIDYEQGNLAASFVEGLARMATPLLGIGGLIFIVKKMTEDPADDFLSPKAKKAQESTGVSLDDVAGIDPIRGEVEEIVRYLKNADTYLKLGAQLPAGVLMVGPPGTGKTLLARAIAGEAKVPFFFAAGSEFMEMFVGVGASRVRNLFEQARKQRPCIIFIDEFDAIGTARESGNAAYGNEETANTINQLLTEMDGFEDNTGLVVLAATNRPAVLDRALVRPGRFDRILRLPLPDLEGRIQILQVHARGKAMAGDLDWRRVARACAGFSGADLENLMNEAAISAIRGGLAVIETSTVFDAIDNLRRDDKTGQMMLNVQTADMAAAIEGLGLRVRATLASYAAGKALCAYMLPWFDEVQKVILFPGGKPDALVLFLPREDNLDTSSKTLPYMQAELIVSLAGRAAEMLMCGEENVSTAAKRDLAAAGDLARVMVLGLGMDPEVGAVSYIDAQEEVFLASERQGIRQRVQQLSPAKSEQAYRSAVGLLWSMESYALGMLRENQGALAALTDLLLEKRVLRFDEFVDFCKKHNVPRWEGAGSLPQTRYDQYGRVVIEDKPIPGGHPSWPTEVTRDPALFAEIKDIPWDELPEALDAYVERAEAEKQLAGWEAQLKEGQHWSEVAGGGKKGGFRLWA